MIAAAPQISTALSGPAFRQFDIRFSTGNVPSLIAPSYDGELIQPRTFRPAHLDYHGRYWERFRQEASIVGSARNIFSIPDEESAKMRWYVEHDAKDAAGYITIAYDKKGADLDTVFNTPRVMILSGAQYLWIQKRSDSSTAGLIYDNEGYGKRHLTINVGGDARFWNQFSPDISRNLRTIGQEDLDREATKPHSTAAAYGLIQYLSKPGNALVAGGFRSGTNWQTKPFNDSAITDEFFSGPDAFILNVRPAASPHIEVDLRRDWLTVSQEFYNADKLNPQLAKLFRNALNRLAKAQ